MDESTSLPPRQQSLRFIEVDGLFGGARHGIDLESGAPTILTGANGSGKSTILRLVNALSNGSIVNLLSAPLDYCRLSFDQGPDFELFRSDSGITLSWGKEKSVLATANQISTLPDWVVEAWETRDFDFSALFEDLSDIAQYNGVPFAEYRDVRNMLRHGKFSSEEILEKPEWLDEFGLGFPVLFVADQRLISESKTRSARPSTSPQTTRRAVEVASGDIAQRLRSADSDYARAAQVMDRRLAEELIRRMGSNAGNVRVDTVAELIATVDERREALQNIGLLDENSSAGASFGNAGLDDVAVRRVVQVVLESTLKNFEVFDDLERRLTTFKRFLDGRLHPKRLELDRQVGMQFGIPEQRPVRPRQLSSGEQQITVLAYEILFKTKPSTLVIIDEPEISLHVSWQDSLVDDLQRMGEASSVQFLLATHSPMILAGHPGLERPLPGRGFSA